MAGFRRLGALPVPILLAGLESAGAATVTDARETGDLPDQPPTVVVFEL